MINYLNKYGGEMSTLERKLLYEWILLYKPLNVLEVGTGEGGGGCYYIAKALAEIGSGSIYTCDPSRGPTPDFLNELTNVKFYQTISSNLIQYIINKKIDINFVFFDGPEEETVAYDDIQILEQYISAGTKFSMHDWETEVRVLDGAISTKAKKIRPYLESSTRWRLLYRTENSGDSVGLCLYEFLG